jgi:hypothetical protein
VSTGFWLAFVALALTGATDTVSMVIRNIVRQLETPDHLRGRMTGVNRCSSSAVRSSAIWKPAWSRIGGGRRSRSSPGESAV